MDNEDEQKHFLSIPTMTFCYKEIHGYGKTYKFKLETVSNGKDTVEFYNSHIEKNCLSNIGDMAKLQWFNGAFIPEINSRSLQFGFRCSNGLFVCSPTSDGHFKITKHLEKDYYDDEKFPRPEDSPLSALCTSDLSCSIYTVIHDYIETRNGTFFHVGLSPIPCSSIFMPTWLTDDTISEMLSNWTLKHMQVAIGGSMVSMRCLSGLMTIQKVSSCEEEPMQLKKPKVIIRQ
jgi:hypothetical protein